MIFAIVLLLLSFRQIASMVSEATASEARTAPPIEHIVDPPRPESTSRVAVIAPGNFATVEGW